MVQNVVNELQILSNTQFIENRVYDEEPEDVAAGIDSQEPSTSSSANKSNQQPDIMPKIKQSLSSGLQFIDHTFSSLSKPLPVNHNFDDDSEEDDHVADEILGIISSNRFTQQPLPHLIGGEEFRRDSFIGLKPDSISIKNYDVVDIHQGIEASGSRDDGEYDSGDDDFDFSPSNQNKFSDDEADFNPQRGLFSVPDEPISIQSPLNQPISSQDIVTVVAPKPVAQKPNISQNLDDNSDDSDFDISISDENKRSTPKPPQLTFKDELESKLGLNRKPPSSNPQVKNEDPSSTTINGIHDSQISTQNAVSKTQDRKMSILFDGSDSDSEDNIFKVNPIKSTSEQLPPKPVSSSLANNKPTDSSPSLPSSKPENKPQPIIAAFHDMINNTKVIEETKRKSLFGNDEDDEDDEDNIFNRKSSSLSKATLGKHSQNLFSDDEEEEESRSSVIKAANVPNKPTVLEPEQRKILEAARSNQNEKPVVNAPDRRGKKLFESSESSDSDSEALFAPKVNNKTGAAAKNGNEGSHASAGRKDLADAQSSSSSLSSAFSSNPQFPDVTSPDLDSANDLFGASEKHLFNQNPHVNSVKSAPTIEVDMNPSGKKPPVGGVAMFGGLTGHIQAAARKRQERSSASSSDETPTTTGKSASLVINNNDNSKLDDTTDEKSGISLEKSNPKKAQMILSSSNENKSDHDEDLFQIKHPQTTKKAASNDPQQDVATKTVDQKPELISSDPVTLEKEFHSDSASSSPTKSSAVIMDQVKEEKSVDDRPPKKPPAGAIPMFMGFNPLMSDLKLKLASKKSPEKEGKSAAIFANESPKSIDEEKENIDESTVKPSLIKRKISSEGPTVVHIDSSGMPRPDSLPTLSSDLHKSRPKAINRRPPSRKPAASIITVPINDPKDEEKEMFQEPKVKPLPVTKNYWDVEKASTEEIKPQVAVMKNVSVSIAKIIRSPSTEGEDLMIPDIPDPDSVPDLVVTTKPPSSSKKPKPLLFDDSDDDDGEEGFFTPQTSISPQTSRDSKKKPFFQDSDSDDDKMKRRPLNSSHSSSDYKTALTVPSAGSSYQMLKSPLDESDSDDNLFVPTKSSASSSDVSRKISSEEERPNPISNETNPRLEQEEKPRLAEVPRPQMSQSKKGLFDDDSDDDGENQ